MKPVVRKGDPTTTGGVVVEGAEDSSDMGKPIARKGDWATCPKCDPHGGPIAEGHEQWHIKGRPVALHGHIVACGCPWGTNKVLSTQFADGVMPGNGDFQGMGWVPKYPELVPGRELTDEEYCQTAKKLQNNQEVQNAVKEMAAKTKAEKMEYSCWFVENADGAISAVNMKTDNEYLWVRPGKKPEGAIGQVHSHVGSQAYPSDSDMEYYNTKPIEERPMVYMVMDNGGRVLYMDDAGNELPCQGR